MRGLMASSADRDSPRARISGRRSVGAVEVPPGTEAEYGVRVRSVNDDGGAVEKEPGGEDRFGGGDDCFLGCGVGEEALSVLGFDCEGCPRGCSLPEALGGGPPGGGGGTSAATQR